MKKTLFVLLSVLLVLFLVACNQDASIDDVYETQSYGAFKVKDSLYFTLEDAIKSVSQWGGVKGDSPIIYLLKDVTDSGAVIDSNVVIDFGTYTYTLSGSKTGIEIKEGCSVEVTSGTFKSKENDESLKSFFNSNGSLVLSNTTIELSNTNLNAIETIKGETDVSGKVSIVVNANSNIVVAGGSSKVIVDEDAEVSLKGSLDLSGEAQINLANSDLTLTRKIHIEGNSVSIELSDMTGVGETPVFSSQPKAMNISPGGKSINLVCSVENNPFVVYQWYISTDGTTKTGTPIENATNPIFAVPEFSETGIYYYYCEAVDSWVESEGVLSNIATVAYTGLPTVYIDAQIPIADITRDEYVAANIVIMGADNYDLSKAITIKGRGNASWDVPKKGYNIKFDKKNSVLSLAEAKKWCVVSNYYDKALMRNWLSTYIANEVQETVDWNPSFKYVDLILNGEYYGNYIIAEAIQINENRINVAGFKNLEKISDPTKYNKGIFLLEIDFRKDARHSFDSTICNIPFTLKDPDFEDNDVSEVSSYVNYIKSVIDAIETEITANGFSEKPLNEIDFIDVDSFVDWYIVEEFAKNLDADFLTSVYMYYDPADGKIHMGPHWDFDHSFGNYVRNYSDKSCSSYDGYWIHNSQGAWNSWYEYLLENTAFLNAIKSRWSVLYPRLTQLCDAIDNKADEIRISAEANFKIWDVLGKNIASDAPGYNNRRTFQSEVDFLKSWIDNRIDWLNNRWGSE